MDESQDYQQIPYANPYSPQGGEQLSGAALAFTDPSDEIEKLRLELLGYYVSSDGTVRKTSRALVNADGAQWIVGLLGSVSNSITTKSQLDVDESNAISLDMCAVLGKAFMRKKSREEFGIETRDRENITTRCRNFAKITAKRAIEGGFSDKKLLKGGITESSMHATQSAQGQGMLSKLFGGGKK